MVKKVAVLGREGIEKYSLSPLIHNTFFEENGIDGKYLAIPILSDNLNSSLKKLEDDGYSGVNLTIPHKVNVLKYLDELDKESSIIGAVNTILFKNQKMIGYNTDAFGFMENLKNKFRDWKNNNKVLLIGAGGASRAVLYGLKSNDINDIIICNRTYEKSLSLAKEFNCEAFEIERINFLLGDRNFIINTTSVGMNENKFIDFDFKKVNRGALFYDIVYTPLITYFLKNAMDLNFKIIDGLGMLLFQAVKSFEIWFGICPKISNDLIYKCLKKLDESC